jgi:hypothetical protein
MKPRTCSECGGRVRQPKGRGRKRFTCGRLCAKKREARLKRAARAAENKTAAAKNAAYLSEFRHWARTGEQAEVLPPPDVLLTVWANHRCRACR